MYDFDNMYFASMFDSVSYPRWELQFCHDCCVVFGGEKFVWNHLDLQICSESCTSCEQTNVSQKKKIFLFFTGILEKT